MSDEPAESRPTPSAFHPSRLAMLVADVAIREEGTGKVSLIGIFDQIRAGTFPMSHGQLVVYARMTDAEGHYEFRLQLVRLEDDLAIGEGVVQAEVSDRLAAGEVIFQLGGLRFERAGRYEFRLHANGRYVGGCPFAVIQVNEGGS